MAQQQQVTPAQMAQVALATMDKANVGADDATLALVVAARGMLRNIMNGSLIVTQAQQPSAAPATSTPAVRGAEGVVAPAPHPLVKPRARKS